MGASLVGQPELLTKQPHVEHDVASVLVDAQHGVAVDVEHLPDRCERAASRTGRSHPLRERVLQQPATSGVEGREDRKQTLIRNLRSAGRLALRNECVGREEVGDPRWCGLELGLGRASAGRSAPQRHRRSEYRLAATAGCPVHQPAGRTPFRTTVERVGQPGREHQQGREHLLRATAAVVTMLPGAVANLLGDGEHAAAAVREHAGPFDELLAVSGGRDR